MLVRLIIRLFKLTFFLIGVVSIAGAWDFLQRSQAADGDYTLQEYAVSVEDRYGDQARAFVHTAWTLAQDGVAYGRDWAKSTGVLDGFGIDLDTLGFAPAEDTATPVEIETVEAPDDSSVVIADANASLAPESSLLPRARALQ